MSDYIKTVLKSISDITADDIEDLNRCIKDLIDAFFDKKHDKMNPNMTNLAMAALYISIMQHYNFVTPEDTMDMLNDFDNIVIDKLRGEIKIFNKIDNFIDVLMSDNKH